MEITETKIIIADLKQLQKLPKKEVATWGKILKKEGIGLCNSFGNFAMDFTKIKF